MKTLNSLYSQIIRSISKMLRFVETVQVADITPWQKYIWTALERSNFADSERFEHRKHHLYPINWKVVELLKSRPANIITLTKIL